MHEINGSESASDILRVLDTNVFSALMRGDSAALGAILVTRNVRHLARIAGLSVEDGAEG